jgi:methylenetetrahydrofolate dehydrogenase (NADP+)/methenyltetrahydrofolate cyclohydrolase
MGSPLPQRAQLIDGNAYALKLRQRIATQVRVLRNNNGLQPGFAVILIGDDLESKSYVSNTLMQAREVGIAAFEHRLPENTTQSELVQLIEALNSDSSVHGIVMRLPLPSHIEPGVVIQTIDSTKDVDGFRYTNAGRLLFGKPNFVPCTAFACLLLLRHATKSKMIGKHAVLIGRSNIVSKPTAILLLLEHCSVTIAPSRTPNLDNICKTANFVIAAVGKPEFVRGDWLKPGAVVIDVGNNWVQRNGSTQVVGDVAFEEARDIVGAITSVPGGVGPVTVACLLANIVKATCAQQGVEVPTGRRRKGTLWHVSRNSEYWVLAP